LDKRKCYSYIFKAGASDGVQREESGGEGWRVGDSGGRWNVTSLWMRGSLRGGGGGGQRTVGSPGGGGAGDLDFISVAFL